MPNFWHPMLQLHGIFRQILIILLYSPCKLLIIPSGLTPCYYDDGVWWWGLTAVQCRLTDTWSPPLYMKVFFLGFKRGLFISYALRWFSFFYFLLFQILLIFKFWKFVSTEKVDLDPNPSRIVNELLDLDLNSSHIITELLGLDLNISHEIWSAVKFTERLFPKQKHPKVHCSFVLHKCTYVSFFFHYTQQFQIFCV